MFNRKSQTILSEHYSKLIDRDEEDSEGGDELGGGLDDETTDDFITLKRRDHDIIEENLPESSYLSKRKLKMGTSKKAMLSTKGNPTKLIFDEEGKSHPLYELAGEEDFRKDGDAKEQQNAFLLAEREMLRVADELDKVRAKDKKRAKKRKMKEFEEGEAVSFILPFSVTKCRILISSD